MPELWFDTHADRALDELDQDPARRRLSERVAATLDALELDAGRAELRRHRFVSGLWGIVVHGDDETWVVLWEPHPTNDDAVVIQYVGPASFA